MTDSPHSPARLLFVDDEKPILNSLKRVFRDKSKYIVELANSGQEGLDRLKEEAFDVIISDMRMPEMDGAEFLSQASQELPGTVRFLLTGYSDQEATIKAINEGRIQAYISKPWDNDELKTLVDEAIDHKRLADEEAKKAEVLECQVDSLQGQAEALTKAVNQAQHELEQTTSYLDVAKDELAKHYDTTVRVFSRVINLRAHTGQEYANSVVTHSLLLGKLLKCNPKALQSIRNAALLHQMGKMSLSDELVTTNPRNLSKEGKDLYLTHPIIAADALTPLPLLAESADIIRHMYERFSGKGKPEGLIGNNIPIGSRILRLTIEYNELAHGVYDGKELSAADAFEQLQAGYQKVYDPEIFDLYQRLTEHLRASKKVKRDTLKHSDQLEKGMITTRDVINHEGTMLIAKGSELTDNLIRQLLRYEQRAGVGLNIYIERPEETK